MKESYPIVPFPTHIDRNYFGAWLSGFTDGEGYFSLVVNSRRTAPSADFGIKLRKDDENILITIQSYFSCGKLYTHHHEKLSTSLQLTFRVSKTIDLVSSVIPHFEQFPLLAKKSRDFILWKQGVNLIHTVSNRPYIVKQEAGTGKLLGYCSKWTEEDLHCFYDIQDALHEQRRYR